ncbi:MAG: ATP-binding protein [Candidatus Delongbacteria bacterium]
MATLLEQLAALQELELRSEGLAQRQERFSRRELDLVLGLARELNTCTTPGEALHFLLHQAIRLAGAQRGAIVELDEQAEGGLRFTLGADRDGFPLARPETQVSHSIIHLVLESGQPLRSSNLSQLEELAQARSVIDLDLKSSLCAPLRRHGRVFGALYVDSSSTTLYSEHMLVLLDGFCELCSLTLTQLQLRRSEQAQQQRFDHFERLHLHIVDSLPNALALYDDQLRLHFANLTFRRELGSLSLVQPDAGSPLGWRFENTFARFLATLGERQEHTADWSVDGRRLRCRPFPLAPEEGGDAVWGLILTDVTTEVRMQQELLESEKFAMMSRTAGSIAHEIRNALAPLHGHVQLARLTLQERPSVLDDLDPDLQVVEEMAGRIERIVRTLSDLSRPPQRQLGEVDLNALAAGTVTLLKDMGGKIKHFDLSVGGPEPDQDDRAGLRIRLDAMPRLPKLLADQEQLQQMLLNLLINAAHAVEAVGGGWVQCRTRVVGDQLLLTVEDTGCGMDEQVLARLWEPYYTTKGEGGSGLGMPLVRQVVEAHQGLIQVQSKPGVGTTFRILFPVANPRQPA